MGFSIMLRNGIYHLMYVLNGTYNDIYFHSREKALAEAFRIQQSLRN